MRTILRRALPALALFALTPGLALVPGAATAEDKPEEIIVTATRVPKPITAIPNTVRILDRQTLDTQLTLSSSIIDGLSQVVPSFSPSRQKLTGSGESFRGRNPLYLIDGVPQSNPLRNGSREGFTIDPFAVERVEVVYGANAIQGLGATGGIVNFVTRSAPRNGDWLNLAKVSVTAADGLEDDGWSHKASVFTAKAWDRWDMAVAASHESRGLFYDAQGRPVGVDTTQGDLMDSDSWNLFGKVGFRPAEGQRIQLMANAFELAGDGDYVAVPGNRLRNIPTSSIRGSYPGKPTENIVRTASLDYTNDDLAGGLFSAQAFLQDFEAVYGGGVFDTFQDPAIDPTGTLFDQSANNSDKHGFKTTWVRDGLLPGLQVAVGLDYLRDETFQELVQTSRNWVPETVYSTWAPFVQLEQTFLDERLRLAGGVRHEIAELKVDDFTTLASYGSRLVEGGNPEFEQTLWNIGGVFTVVEGVQLYGSYAEGFTMPDVGRVLRGISQPGQNVEDFLNLQPIVADNLEVGVEVRRGPVTAGAAWFSSASDFGQVLVLNADGIFEINRQKTEIDGVELSLRWDVTDAYAIGANYATLDGRFDFDGDGKVDRDLDGANIAPDRLNAYAEAEPVDGLTTRLQLAHYFDRSFDGNDPRNDFEGFALFDLYAGYRLPVIGGLTEAPLLELGVQNLLDRQYTTYWSQTTRPTDNTAFFAGRGRTWTVSLTARF